MVNVVNRKVVNLGKQHAICVNERAEQIMKKITDKLRMMGDFETFWGGFKTREKTLEEDLGAVGLEPTES